jgi:hypothetical protein
VKKGDKVWFTDWRGMRQAGVIKKCARLKGRPVFDISVDDEPQTRRGYTWQITPRG